MLALKEKKKSKDMLPSNSLIPTCMYIIFFAGSGEF